jgi:hypothetical protein
MKPQTQVINSYHKIINQTGPQTISAQKKKKKRKNKPQRPVDN